MSELRLPMTARRALVAVIAALIVGVPAVVQVLDRPHFGWQMFSFLEPFPASVVLEAGETTVPVDVDQHVARKRGDVAFAEALPPHLCTIYPAADAVLMTIAGEPVRHECP